MAAATATAAATDPLYAPSGFTTPAADKVGSKVDPRRAQSERLCEVDERKNHPPSTVEYLYAVSPYTYDKLVVGTVFKSSPLCIEYKFKRFTDKLSMLPLFAFYSFYGLFVISPS